MVRSLRADGGRIQRAYLLRHLRDEVRRARRQRIDATYKLGAVDAFTSIIAWTLLQAPRARRPGGLGRQ